MKKGGENYLTEGNPTFRQKKLQKMILGQVEWLEGLGFRVWGLNLLVQENIYELHNNNFFVLPSLFCTLFSNNYLIS